MTNYQQCEFDENFFLTTPEVGDSFVTSLTVLIEKHELKLITDYRMGTSSESQTEILFSGVQAHHFDHVIDPSIIFGIEDSDIEHLYEIWEHIFLHGKNYGWPVDNDGKDDLIIKIRKKGIKCYKVYGSCGLDGFVLATGISYRNLRKL